jgi:hypothetical protein
LEKAPILAMRNLLLLSGFDDRSLDSDFSGRDDRPAACRRGEARSEAEDDKGAVFCFAMQRAPQGPAEKTGTRHCGKRSRRSRSWPRFARSRSRVIAPMQETDGYSDASPEHETAQSFACLTSNADVEIVDAGGDDGAPAAALRRKRDRCRRWPRNQGETASCPPLDDPFPPPISPIVPMKATCLRLAPLRSAPRSAGLASSSGAFGLPAAFRRGQ